VDHRNSVAGSTTPTVPFMREVWRKGPADGEPWTVDGTWERRFYDGLGRLVQTHTPYQDWYGFCSGCGHEVVTAVQYDGLGQQVAVTVPYFKTAYVYDPDCEGTGKICNPYVEPDWEQPQTRYAYDPLGRPAVVTQTDGTTVTTFYHERLVAVVDEAHHLAVNESDAFGRLVRVREYTGTYDFRSDPQWAAPAYATTVYSHTVRDALAGVEDALGHQTVISYDTLGRKVGMVDPDMGAWLYQYDPQGNLVEQVDARGNKVCLRYDTLNRLTHKLYRESSEKCPGNLQGQPPAATYSYDDTTGGNYGRGRRCLAL
jgi:YD repeat-containing protein